MSAGRVRRWRIEPLDTLFFGDGRPFNQEDEGLAEAESLFPPWPSTTAGAFRAALARALGWDGRSDWSTRPEIAAVVGGSPDEPAPLRFGPPVVLWRTAQGGWERLYPRPAHVMVKMVKEVGQREEPRLLDLPRGPRFRTDLGEIVLPDAEPGVKEPKAGWVTARGLTSILEGKAPKTDELITDKRLFAPEFRIGLQRDHTTRTAAHGMLYAVRHLRLFDGVGRWYGKAADRDGWRRVALGLEVAGPADHPPPAQPTPLGGLQRLVGFHELADGWREATEPAEPPADGRYLVHILSPTRFRDGSWPRPDASLDGKFPGRLVFACCGRPQYVGGWDGRSGVSSFGPQPNRPHLPAGSVLFFEVTDEAERRRLAELWRSDVRAVGERTALGFGHFRFGYWPRRESGR